jgi:hypothetical protein
MESFDLVYGTGCKSKAVQTLVDEQLGRNPFMLALWRKKWSSFRGTPNQPTGQVLVASFRDQINSGEVCILGGNSKQQAQGVDDIGVSQGTALPSDLKASDKDLSEEEGKDVLRIGGGDGVGKEKEAGAAGDVMEAEAKDWEAWDSFMDSMEVQAISTCISDMFQKTDSDPRMRRKLLKLLDNIVFERKGVNASDVLKIINLRYFVFDVEDGGLSCAFPLVRSEIARFLDESEGGKYFYTERAWKALTLAVKNGEAPSVVGVFVEKCCNAAITVGGGHKVILPHV